MPPTPLSPEWWVARLYAKLQDRIPEIERLEAYADGNAPYPWLATQAAEAFKEILRLSRSNYMGLVVDATYERLRVQGFHRTSGHDSWAWQTWQSSNMDRWFPQGMRQAVLSAQSYLMVSPRKNRRPRLTVEHPSHAIVEYAPGDYDERAAGLRVWVNDQGGEEPMVNAVLYLPDRTLFLQGPKGSPPARWDERRPEETNPYGVVPLIEMPNNPDLFGHGRSEIADVIDAQDRVNKTIMDRLVTQDYGAFPQKFAEGWPEDDEEGDDEVPLLPDGRQVHPDANLIGASGGQAPLPIGRTRMVTAPAGVKFGQFESAAMDPYSAAKREDVKDISARTRIPPHFLLGDIANMSADGLIAAESGLVGKLHERKEPFADAAEEALRLAYLMDDSGTAPAVSADELESIETTWADLEFRSIAQVMDAWGKGASMLGVPVEAAWAKIGTSPQEIEDWKRMESERSLRTLGTDIASLLTPPVPQVPAPPPPSPAEG